MFPTKIKLSFVDKSIQTPKVIIKFQLFLDIYDILLPVSSVIIQLLSN